MARKRRKQKKSANPGKRKPGVSGTRYRKEAAFKNSRRAAGEFGQASQCAVLIRQELARLLELPRENELHKKLSRIIGRLIREKRVSGTGPAGLNHVPWERLNPFEFNEKTGLGTLVYGKSDVSILPASGEITITISAFKVKEKITSLKSVTHVRVVTGVAAIDFDERKACNDYTATDHIPIKQPAGDTIRLSLRLPAPVIHPVFVVVGFLCYKEVNKAFCELGNAKYKALAVERVLPAPAPV